MSSPPTVVRCPACGQDLQAVLAPAPPTQWFPCPRCHAPVPVLRPRDLPPLYSWEVLPGLYPALPRPRTPRWRARQVSLVGLAVIVAVAVLFAGVFTYYAFAAAAPGEYAVNGTVYTASTSGSTRPALGVTVTVDEEGGSTASTITGTDGGFAFPTVPSGGITVHVALAGYGPATVATFASPVYNAGTTGLAIVLVPTGSGNSTNATLTPFPDLESFLASIGTGVAILGLAAAVALVAAVVTLRADRPAIGVVGGGAGLAAPFALYLMGLSVAFPLLVALTAMLGALGAFVLALRAADIAQAAPVPATE